MAVNIAQVGVDPKSGAPIKQRSTAFTFNNDVNGTTDIFYHFGSRLQSSSFVNPNTTQFLTASRLADGGGNPTIVGVGDNAVDNSALTALFSASTDANSGFQAEFLADPFILTNLLINSDDFNWTVEGSNNGTAWSTITQGSVFGPAAGWFLINISNATPYLFYRILHGDAGTPKDLNTVKFFGTYNNGDLSFSIPDEANLLITHLPQGIVYLPDAVAEVFPTNYYINVLHTETGNEYTFSAFSGGATPVNDTTNGSLNPGESLICRFTGTQWDLFKVGSGVDITTKGALLTSDGTITSQLVVGSNGQLLKANSATGTGLEWDSIGYPDLNAPTAPIDVNGQPITGLPLFPAAPTEAVSKNYADSIAAGFDPKESCEVATNTDLDTETGLTWTPAGASVGKTLTASAGTATIDTVPLVNNYRVLVKDQTPASDNGVYVVSGVGGSNVVLTRATDFDRTEVVSAGAFTFITEGANNISTGFILVGTGNFSVDTTPLNFSKFVGSGALTLNSLSDVATGTPGAADDGKLIGWNDTTGFFELREKAGTAIGDLVELEDVAASPGLPAVDGTQITLNASQVSPLTTKGDVWGYSTVDTRLPIGSDNQFLAAQSAEATGLKWKGIASTDMTVGADATNVTVNFTTSGGNTILGPLTIETALSPLTNEFLRYNGSEFASVDPTGTGIGDILAIADVGGSPGLPVLDGSNLTNLSVGAGQGSPLTTKGDLYIFDTTNDRLPVGADDTILVADSTTGEGLAYKDVREVSRHATLVVNEGAVDKTTVNHEGTDDIIYFVGTEEGTTSFSEPQGAGLLNMYRGDLVTNYTNIDRLTDRIFSGTSFGIVNSVDISIDFLKPNYVRPTAFYIKAAAASTVSSTITVRAGDTIAEAEVGGTGPILGTGSFPTGWAIDDWLAIPVTAAVGYQYFSLDFENMEPGRAYFEIEVYGYVNTSTEVYTLKADDEKSILRVNTAITTNIEAPAGFNEGFYFFVQNQGTGTVNIAATGGSTILGNNTIYNTADLLFVSNIGSNTWLVSNTGGNVLTTKGDIATYSTQSAALSVGTDGQILAANSLTDTGLLWEDKQSLEELATTVNVPPVVLSTGANDIFEWIGTDGTFSGYVNPVNSGPITGTTSGNNAITFLTDQFISTSVVIDPGEHITWQFNENRVKVEQISIYGDISGTFDIEVSDTGSSWVTVTQYTYGTISTWESISIVLPKSYTYLRFVGVSQTGFQEVKLFGDISSIPPKGNLLVSDGSEYIEQAVGGDDLVLVSDSTAPGGVKWDIVPSTAQSVIRIPATEVTMAATLQLTTADNNLQVLDPDGANRIVVLPDPPIASLYFKIVNTDAANYDIDIEETLGGGVVKTLDVDTPYVEAHYTGTQWIILD